MNTVLTVLAVIAYYVIGLTFVARSIEKEKKEKSDEGELLYVYIHKASHLPLMFIVLTLWPLFIFVYKAVTFLANQLKK